MHTTRNASVIGKGASSLKYLREVEMTGTLKVRCSVPAVLLVGGQRTSQCPIINRPERAFHWRLYKKTGSLCWDRSLDVVVGEKRLITFHSPR